MLTIRQKAQLQDDVICLFNCISFEKLSELAKQAGHERWDMQHQYIIPYLTNQLDALCLDLSLPKALPTAAIRHVHSDGKFFYESLPKFLEVLINILRKQPVLMHHSASRKEYREMLVTEIKDRINTLREKVTVPRFRALAEKPIKDEDAYGRNFRPKFSAYHAKRQTFLVPFYNKAHFTAEECQVEWEKSHQDLHPPALPKLQLHLPPLPQRLNDSKETGVKRLMANDLSYEASISSSSTTMSGEPLVLNSVSSRPSVPSVPILSRQNLVPSYRVLPLSKAQRSQGLASGGQLQAFLPELLRVRVLKND